MKVELWDGKTPINNVPANIILQTRPDIWYELGDVFLVYNDKGIVTRIEIGDTISKMYNMRPGLSTIEIAEKYAEIIKNEIKNSKKETLYKEGNVIRGLFD